MDVLIGIAGKDFLLLAADMTQVRSIVVLKSDEDKILDLDSHKLLALDGSNGDRVNFSQFIQKNMALYNLQNGTSLSTLSAANFIRKKLHNALRSNPYQVNILLAGWDKDVGPSLYYIDYLASMTAIPFAVHGYASYFLSGLLDKNYRKDLNFDDALSLIRMCITELQTRFLVNISNFIIKHVGPDGIKIVNF